MAHERRISEVGDHEALELAARLGHRGDDDELADVARQVQAVIAAGRDQVSLRDPAPGVDHVVVARAESKDGLPGGGEQILQRVGLGMTGAEPGSPAASSSHLVQRPTEHDVVERLVPGWVEDEAALTGGAWRQRLVGFEARHLAAADTTLEVVHRAERGGEVDARLAWL